MDATQVLGTDEVRVRLTALLGELTDGSRDVVVVGRHRRPEAALVGWERWRRTAEAEERGAVAVLGPAVDLQPWTERESLDLEVAQDLLGDLVGWYSGQLAAQSAESAPDPVRVAECRVLVAALARQRRELSIRDRAGVVQVITEYGPLVRRLYGDRT